MLKLYFFSLRRTVLSHKTLFVFIILGITAAMFCISITLGSARDDYEKSLNINYLTSLTVSFEEGDTDKNTSLLQINQNFSDELLNVLYITKTQDSSHLIGWQGSSPMHWFPLGSGRFFNSKETDAKAQVVFIGWTEYAEVVKPNQTNILFVDGIEYKIIGEGGLTPFNFSYSISSSSTQQLFQSNITSDYKFRIIPYTTFFERYEPDLVLVQFNQLSYEQLEERKNMLQSIFPNANITMPSHSSDDYLTTEKLKRSAIGTLFAVIIGISIIGIMLEWLKLNYKQYHVYSLCGVTKRGIVGLILLEWFTYLLFGTVFAIAIHKSLLPWLQWLGVGYLPDIADIARFCILFFTITIIASLKKIKECTDLHLKGDLL